MSILYGSVDAQGVLPSEPQLDYGFYNIFPVIPSIDSSSALPTTWPPPSFWTTNPTVQGNYQPAYQNIPETPFKDDAQLDRERQQIQALQNPGISPSSWLWLLALGAAVYYVTKKGG